MIKEGLLGLIALQPMHGYDLKTALDRLFGRTTPVNVGQVYTAIAKLERDGLVRAERVARADRSELKVFHLTENGSAELQRWFREPVEKVALRDEFFLKLTLARRSGQADAGQILRRQRAAHIQTMQELTILKSAETEIEPEIVLLIEGAILHLEADLRWLELLERRMLGTQ